jgi:hypothetical protein
MEYMEGKENYAQFIINPSGLSMSVPSRWECRNAGLLKIMTRVFENLQDADLLKDEFTIRINTADGISRNVRPAGVRNYIEFDTSTDGTDESLLFPDYIFGNWWHIGLRNFGDFTEDIIRNSGSENIEDGRIFWIGATQGVSQRINYLNLCERNPEKLCGDRMHWTGRGRVPTSNFVSMKDHCRFKYLIDLTGQGVSGRLKILPFCGRPLFIADRRLWAWSDIVIIKERLHIGVKEDLGDLLDLYDRTERNQSEAFEKSRALASFCREKFDFSSVCGRATQLVADSMERLSKKRASKRPIKVDVVVAHYKEDLSWLKRLNHDLLNNVFVYTKSGVDPGLEGPRFRKISLENVGRESHTYLWHCVDQYESIASGSSDFVFFIQGSPHGMNERVIGDWMDEVADNCLKYTYNFRLSSPYDFLKDGRLSRWGGALNQPADCDVREWCHRFIKPVEKFDNIPVFWNACFGVSADRILSNERGKYERIVKDELCHPNPECGHYCERLWYYMFNLDEIEAAPASNGCYEFWGGRDGKHHYGVLKLNDDGSIGLYGHPNESFWKRDGDSIILMDRMKNPTSSLNKVGDDMYVGSFLSLPKSMHRLVGISGQRNQQPQA